MQHHLAVDFPIKGPASVKALGEKLPKVMPDLAQVQDDLGTVHFSRFMIKGDEKLLFLSDIDGEIDRHIESLVEKAGPVLDAILEHVKDPPATSVADDQQAAIEWLKRHARKPLDTYFAYEDASVQEIKQYVRAAGFTGSTSQNLLLTYMTFKSRIQAFAVKLLAPPVVGEKGDKASDAIGTLHVAHFVPFDNNETEQLMKQVATGRKNWLFIGSIEAGRRAAILLTIVSTAHRYHLDIWRYVKDVLDRLLAGERDLTSLRADRWATVHPDALRPHRIEEARYRADAKATRRARRRQAEKQRSAKK
jgi:hypothetical protein